MKTEVYQIRVNPENQEIYEQNYSGNIQRFSNYEVKHCLFSSKEKAEKTMDVINNQITRAMLKELKSLSGMTRGSGVERFHTIQNVLTARLLEVISRRVD